MIAKRNRIFKFDLKKRFPGNKAKKGKPRINDPRPSGAPGRIRTCDLPVRSRALYPLSYKRIWCRNALKKGVSACVVPPQGFEPWTP